MKHLLLLIPSLWISAALLPAQAQEQPYITFSQTLDQQVALVYCMGKDFAYRGIQAEESRATRELDSCITLFEENYRQLEASELAAGAVAKGLTKMLATWNDYRWATKGTATHATAAEVITKAELLVAAIRGVEEALNSSNAAKKVGYSAKVVDPLIRTSDKLVILAQAMAMDYAFCAWKLPEGVHCTLLLTHEQEFSESLYQLLITTANDQQIEDEISVIAKYWKTMKALHHKTGAPSPSEAFSLANTLSIQSNKVTALYLALAR